MTVQGPTSPFFFVNSIFPVRIHSTSDFLLSSKLILLNFLNISAF